MTTNNNPPNHDALIVALDVPTAKEAKALVEQIGDAASFYKIGLELAMTPDYFALLDWLVAQDKRVFCDLKLHDIPATVGRAVARLADSGADLLTIHAGQAAMLEAAAKARAGDLRLLVVTLLTSINQQDLMDMGVARTPLDQVIANAEMAETAGIDGVVCSGHELPMLREEYGDELLTVVPGIRPTGVDAGDQQRVMTPGQAIAAGANHIVVGRAIRDATDPAAAAAAIQDEIAAAI